MKKIVFFVLLLLPCMFTLKVEAKVINSGYMLADNCVVDDSACQSLFGDPECSTSVAHYLQEIFTAIKWIAPILCMVLIFVDFVKAITNPDKDNMGKTISRTIKRVVAALLLFFLPSLINFLFPLLGWYGTCGIG